MELANWLIFPSRQAAALHPAGKYTWDAHRASTVQARTSTARPLPV